VTGSRLDSRRYRAVLVAKLYAHSATPEFARAKFVPIRNVRLAEEDLFFRAWIAREGIRENEALVRSGPVRVLIILRGDPKVRILQPFFFLRKPSRKPAEPFTRNFTGNTEVAPIPSARERTVTRVKARTPNAGWISFDEFFREKEVSELRERLGRSPGCGFCPKNPASIIRQFEEVPERFRIRHTVLHRKVLVHGVAEERERYRRFLAVNGLPKVADLEANRNASARFWEGFSDSLQKGVAVF
jgi:hypothetical protein